MAQPIVPEPHERPHLAGRPDRPPLAESPDQAMPAEPEDQPLLAEPPERPRTGPLRAPVSRGRRSAADKYADGQTSPLPPRGAGWTVISYLIAGMIAYGGIGWLVSRAVHAPVIFPVGMLFGLGVSLGLVIYRYGRSSSTQKQHAQEMLREEPAGDR